jgi:hypothetical protein
MIYNVGDKAWLARDERKAVEIPCPVCFGKLRVILTLGNGDEVSLNCNACERGYYGPQGTITEYEYTAGAIQVTIDGVDIEQSPRGEKREYRWGSTGGEYASSWHNAHEGELFATKEEALEECKKLVSQREADQLREIAVKCKPGRSYSWNAGYHLTCAKKAHKEAEYHEKMAVVCKGRSKE